MIQRADGPARPAEKRDRLKRVSVDLTVAEKQLLMRYGGQRRSLAFMLRELLRPQLAAVRRGDDPLKIEGKTAPPRKKRRGVQ